MKQLKATLNWFQCEETLDERLTSQLHGFSQNFKDQAIDEMYYHNNQSQSVSLFRICTVSLILINVFFALTNKYISLFQTQSALRAGYAAWLFCILIIQKKYNKQWVIDVLIVCSTCFNLGITYGYFIVNVLPNTNVPFFVLTNVLYGLVNFLISSSWQGKFFILVGFFIQYNVVYSKGLKWQGYILMLLILIIIRIKDRHIKLMYLNLIQQNKNILACKEIFDKCVRSSILIIKLEEQDILQSLIQQETELQVLYANQFAQKYLKCSNETDCKQQPQKIKLMQDEQKDLSLIQILKEQIEDDHLFSMDFDYALGKEQKSYNGCLIEQFQNSNIEQYCDLNIKSCRWEGQKSILISMTDTTDKLKHIAHLKELNNYKDQLLATVSHDLKTPLNAIVINQQKQAIGSILILGGQIGFYNQII